MLYINKRADASVPITRWLLIAATWCVVSSAESVTVQISDGPIVGSQLISSWTNKTVYTFLGIPYASSPVGDLRFKPPVPPANWTAPKDCTKYGSSCMQSMPGCSEDCLFLNVYSPELKPAGELAPVYIWIHGGGFVYGAGDWYQPDSLVAEGVVVITINYRLGAFGFLTLGTSEMPGNVALFDQVLAMKWVQKEITKFGGDPNKVTIGGESAGSMSVHCHYISPVPKGLFRAAVAESGTSLVYLTPDGAPEFGLKLAELSNCSTADLNITQQCLRNISADVILLNQNLVTAALVGGDSLWGNRAPWVPIVDKDTNKDNPFLPALPAELITQGKGSAVPILLGSNRDEGTISFTSTAGFDLILQDLDDTIRSFIPPAVLAASSNSSIQDKINQVKTAYFDGDKPSLTNYLGYIKLFGDYVFDYPTGTSARKFSSRSSSVFLYSFTFDGDFKSKTSQAVGSVLNTSLVGHMDELAYLFLVPVFSNQTYTDPKSRDMVTFNRMVKLWTNFIKNGTPTPSPDSDLQNVTWTPVQNNKLHFLEISDNLTMVQSDYNAKAMQLWDSVFAVPSSGASLLASMSLLSVLTLLSQL